MNNWLKSDRELCAYLRLDKVTIRHFRALGMPCIELKVGKYRYNPDDVNQRLYEHYKHQSIAL